MEGPEFLACSEEEWPKCPASASGEESAVFELVKNPLQVCHTLLTEEQEVTSETDISKIIDCHAFSSITRLLRVTAYVLTFIRNLKKKVKGIQRRKVSHYESEALWIRSVQNLTFEREMKYLYGNQRSSPLVLVSVVRFESVRAVFALSVQRRSKLHAMDVIAAFLNGELENEV